MWTLPQATIKPHKNKIRNHMRKELIRKSKYLSKILRHQPDLIGISLDREGWVAIGKLTRASTLSGTPLTREEVEEITQTNPKQRFEIKEGKIRARQGHSIPVDLKLEAIIPPDTLYHGTADRNLQAILAGGLNPMSRQFVHLSQDIPTATAVGSRHGKPIILEIKSAEMHKQGHQFFLSSNGVWLTKSIAPKYIQKHAGTYTRV